MRGKGWGSVRLDLAAYLSQVRHAALSQEHAGRLALAWPAVWATHGGEGAPEEAWRKALGYGPDDWQLVRTEFSCALEGEKNWNLPFMAAEGERQAAVSRSQADKVAKRWNTAVSRGLPDDTNAYPASSKRTNYTKTNSRARARGGESEAFVAFWEAYPKRIDRNGCARLWASFRLDAEAPVLMAGLTAWVAYWQGRDPQYTPHPSTWLRQRRWEAAPDNSAPRPNGENGKTPDDDGWKITGPPHKWGAK